MDGIYSMVWQIFGLVLSLGLFLWVAITGAKHLALKGIAAAAEVADAWDKAHPKTGMPTETV